MPGALPRVEKQDRAACGGQDGLSPLRAAGDVSPVGIRTVPNTGLSVELALGIFVMKGLV